MNRIVLDTSVLITGNLKHYPQKFCGGVQVMTPHIVIADPQIAPDGRDARGPGLPPTERWLPRGSVAIVKELPKTSKKSKKAIDKICTP